jgi:hypothetical protein
MAVISTTLSGVNVFQFSGAVTDAEINTAWSALIVNGVYVINRAIYLDNTADLTGVTGGFLVDLGTQVNPGFILHTGRDKTKSTFRNFTFLQRTGLSVVNRTNFVRTWNGTSLASPSGSDGLSQNGGGMVYGVPGNPGGGDPRYLNEMSFAGLEGVTIYSQEFTEQELQIIIAQTTQLKGITFEKAYGFPQIGTTVTPVNVTVYRSTQNTQSLAGGGLIPIRLFPFGGRYASVCYVDSYVTRNNADITTRLIDTFGANASNIATIMVLNNYTRESWFGASKTNIPVTASWAATNIMLGGVLKKLQFVGGDGGVVRAYDSRSTTAAQKCAFQETGTSDFLNASLAPTTDAQGRISLVHIGAIAQGTGAPITRYTGQRFTFQKFGYRVRVANVDMTSGDNDLSAFTPVILTEQSGIARTQSAINTATSITSFQDLLEELHVLAIGLVGEQSYNGYAGGNLFTFEAGELKTNFTNVIVDATAASKISYNASTNTLTIKASILTATNDVSKWNNSIGIISLVNGSQIQGVYQDSTGTSTVLEISGFDAGSAVYVEDNNEIEKFFSASASGTVTVYIPPSGTGSWYYAVEKYGIQRQSDFFTFSGGLKEIVVKAIPDIGLTESNVATVAAYTALENPDKIYDYVAYLRTTTPHISYGQILFKDGTSLYLEDASMLVNQSFGSVASFNYDTKLLTIKSLVLETGVSYTKIVADPPATVTANTNEIITILIEDANGDSKLNILGGDNLGYELWKVTTATATDDYATGTLLATLPDNLTGFRFIGISGFDIVGRDVSSGVRRRSSMLKGVYNQAFYVGDQIQLATNAPQLEENNQKLDELILKTDTNLDVKVSSRLATIDYVAPDNTKIAQIKTKVDTLENYDDSILQGKVDDIQTKVDTLENTDLTGIALEATSQEILTTVQDIDVDFTPVLDAIDLTLKTSEYTAPDNVKIEQIKTKVDTLENTNISTLATTVQLEEAKDEILANSSGATPEEIADQVWMDQPDRLKNVSTVQITGEQLKTYIDQ